MAVKLGCSSVLDCVGLVEVVDFCWMMIGSTSDFRLRWEESVCDDGRCASCVFCLFCRLDQVTSTHVMECQKNLGEYLIQRITKNIYHLIDLKF